MTMDHHKLSLGSLTHTHTYAAQSSSLGAVRKALAQRGNHGATLCGGATHSEQHGTHKCGHRGVTPHVQLLLSQRMLSQQLMIQLLGEGFGCCCCPCRFQPLGRKEAPALLLCAATEQGEDRLPLLLLFQTDGPERLSRLGCSAHKPLTSGHGR
jgi:hypothetical protein